MRRILSLTLTSALLASACSASSSAEAPRATREPAAATSGGDHTPPAQPPPPSPPPPPAQAQPAPPAQPAGPPPPRYTEVDAFLRSDPRGARCIQGNIIDADLTDSYADVDLDGDGAAERVFQARDCLVVSRRAGDHWDVVSITPRAVGRDVETVTVRPTQDRRGVETVDLRGTNREVQRFRWSGSTLTPLQ